MPAQKHWTRRCDKCGDLIDSARGDHVHTTGLKPWEGYCCLCWCLFHDLNRCIISRDAKARGVKLERV